MKLQRLNSEGTIEVYAEIRNFEREVNILFARRDPVSDLRICYAPAVFEPLPASDDMAQPTMTLERRVAQTLLDALCGAGMRPTGQPDAAPTINAIKAHLEDMRRLVFEQAWYIPPAMHAAPLEKTK